jgi:hypothetical protein
MKKVIQNLMMTRMTLILTQIMKGDEREDIRRRRRLELSILGLNLRRNQQRSQHTDTKDQSKIYLE